MCASSRPEHPSTASAPAYCAIPVDEGEAEADKPGWIVDGQQRTAAIRDADVDSFPIYVTAFVTDSVADQRSQFILVNSTKPLPKGLIHELLPSTPAGDLPPALLKRRYPALLLDRLNYDAGSPLQRRIRTPTTAEGTIKDNSILKMLSMSIEDGALYNWFDGDTGTRRRRGDADARQELLAGRVAGLPRRLGRSAATLTARAWRRHPGARLPDGRDQLRTA